jgi:myxalamid-type polyketide synthase MxaB
MAERLLEQKLGLGALVLFDSPMPSIFSHVDLGDDARFLYDLVNFSNHFAGAKMEVSYEALKALDSEAQLEAVLNEAKRHRVLPAEVPADHLRRLVEVCRTHVRIVQDYQPRSIRRTVQMFRPAIRGVLSEASGRVLDEHLGWGELLGSYLVREKALGDHFSMMIGDNARRLAKSVVAKLGTAASPRGL